MSIAFIHPELLWLLLLVPLLWALALVGPRRLARWRFWTSLGLRTVIALGLIGALAGTQIVQAIGATTTIFLLDGSDSVALSQRAGAEGFIQQALAGMPADDRAGLVVFGQQALVERPASTETTLGQVQVQPGGAATDLESALQLALAMLPNEGHQRLVLLSDGGENEGNSREAARLAAERGIPIDIVALNGQADGPDAQISRLSLPANARLGQQLVLQIGIDSNVATSGRLQVEGPGGELIADQPIDLPQGRLDLTLNLPEPPTTFSRYSARISIENDARPENNAAEAYSFISGQPQVLLVEGEPGAAENLSRALAAASIQTTTVAAASMPTSIGDLSTYDAVVLLNVPRRAVGDQTQAALAAYVHDLGRGLLMVGGVQSFGAGSWRDTPIETALPVSMDIPSEYTIPPASLVVLIDTSGSMGEEEGGRSKLQLAADGAAQIAALMRDEDDITVIPFDTDPGRIVGPIDGSRRDEAIGALRSIDLGGGGIEITDGLAAAEQAILRSTKPVRHIITLTDGGDTEQQEGAMAIIERLRNQKITLSSIAIGDGSDVPFLKNAVASGGGRFFLTTRASELPSIMTDEAAAVLRSYVVEKAFQPVQQANHPILRNISSVPGLGGYIVTSPKATSQVLLATPEGEPVLAAWQYGLGHALAWTSDMQGRWASDWVAWQEFPRFSAQLISWLLPAPSSSLLSLQPETVNGQLVLVALAQDAQGRPRSGLQITGRLLRGDGNGSEVSLREVGAGRYQAAVSGVEPGAYLVQLLANDAEGLAGALTGGVVVPQSAEYRSQGANPGLLAELARMTGGRTAIAPTDAFAPNTGSRGAVSEISWLLLLAALLLLPFDIAVRRLFLGRRSFQPAPAMAAPLPAAVETKAPTSTAAPTKPEPVKPRQSKREADMERLRAAQEQARRRARGED